MAEARSADPGAAAQAAPSLSNKYTVGNVVKALVAGGLAGGISRTAVAPLERLKILMQVQGNDRVYRNTWQVGGKVVWMNWCWVLESERSMHSSNSLTQVAPQQARIPVSPLTQCSTLTDLFSLSLSQIHRG